MDHFYKSLPSWFDFEDVYRDAVDRAPRGGTLVEVGVYEGASLAFLAVEAVNAGKDLHVVGVDKFDWPPAVWDRVSSLFKFAGSGVTLHRALSDESAALFADCSVDFVFIDADHSEASVRKDIAAWRPKVKPGGTIAGHDLVDEFPGVGVAVREAFPTFEACSVRSWRVRL